MRTHNCYCNNDWFSKEQNNLAYDILIQKLKIIIAGATKRSNEEILKKYSEKLKFWVSQSDILYNG